MVKPVSLRMLPERERNIPVINTWEQLTNRVKGFSERNFTLPNSRIGVDNNLMILERAFTNPRFYNSLTDRQRELFLDIMRLHIEAGRDYQNNGQTTILGCSP